MEWISVDERLPEDNAEQLTYDGWGIYTGEYRPRRKNPIWVYMNDENKEETYHGVTHWMPLPEPPK